MNHDLSSESTIADPPPPPPQYFSVILPKRNSIGMSNWHCSLLSFRWSIGNVNSGQYFHHYSIFFSVIYFFHRRSARINKYEISSSYVVQRRAMCSKKSCGCGWCLHGNIVKCFGMGQADPYM